MSRKNYFQEEEKYQKEIQREKIKEVESYIAKRTHQLNGHDASITQNLKMLDAALKDSRRTQSDLDDFTSKT